MSTYTPDKWAIIELKTKKETLYKVLASWYGGFVGSNSWKLSSGITSMTETEHTYDYHNYSSSVYVCPKAMYGTSMHTHSVYLSWLDQPMPEGVSIRLLDEQEALGMKFNASDISGF